MSSGGSKDQIIGYRYFLAVHMGISRGPVNEVVQIDIGDRTAWSNTGYGQTGTGSDLPVYYGGGTGSGGGTGGTPPESGGDVGGGYNPPFCPAPDVPILRPDGSTVRADAVEVGMLVWTQPESGGEYGAYAVSAARRADGDLFRLTLADGRSRCYSRHHKIKVEDGWRPIQHLKTGDEVLGTQPGVVLSVEPEGRGPVIQISVHDAKTYVSDGLLSHNLKDLGDGQYQIP